MNSALTLDSRIRQSDDIVASDIDNEKVMMSIEQGAYFGLDPIGSRIWELLEQPLTVAELIEQLLQRYDVDRETCIADLMPHLVELQENGLLQVEN